MGGVDRYPWWVRAWIVCVVALAGACSQPPPVTPAPVVVDVAPKASSLPVAKSDPVAPEVPIARGSDRGAVDPAPPRGWQRCAGFVNTEADDVDEGFLEACLGDKLRVRVFDPNGKLEEDVAVEGITARSWPRFDYFGRGGHFERQTSWGTADGATSALFGTDDGRDACGQQAAPRGATLGSGYASKAIIAPGATGYDEYRVSCGGPGLPNRTIVLYR